MSDYNGPLKYDDSFSKDLFRISPSGFIGFFSHTNVWYREHLMKEKTFLGNTSTVLGTCVHYLNEHFCKGTDISTTVEEIIDYVKSFDWNIEVDQDRVLENMFEMHEAFIPYMVDTKSDHLELDASTPIIDGVVAAGSIDAYNSHTGIVTDYKTYNSKTKPKSIAAKYRYQMLIYAYILRKSGYTVNQFDVVYVNVRAGGGLSEKTGKPLKAYPPEPVVLSEPVTNESMLFIESVLNLVAESAVKFIKNPDMRYLLAQDYRLKDSNSCAYEFKTEGL